MPSCAYSFGLLTGGIGNTADGFKELVLFLGSLVLTITWCVVVRCRRGCQVHEHPAIATRACVACLGSPAP